MYAMNTYKNPTKTNVAISVDSLIKIFLLVLIPAIVPFNSKSKVLSLSFGGYCTRCNTHHVLPTTDEAKQAALDLRQRMIRSGRIDIDELPVEEQKRLLCDENGQNLSIGVDENQGGDSCADVKLDPLLSIERLYERRGKMFGILVCESPRSTSKTIDSESKSNPNLLSTIYDQDDMVILKAYAGKLGGQWNLPGWAPLVGKVPESIPEFRRKSAEVTDLFGKIERLSLEERETEDPTTIAEQIKDLTKERSRLSTLCIDELRRHQILKNFRGIRMPIKDAFVKGPTKLPGGTGDCAAPKLVAQAVKLGLKPTGICEIFIGATGGMSTTKGDGKFYDACEPRCQQIAGYMLCGLEI